MECEKELKEKAEGHGSSMDKWVGTGDDYFFSANGEGPLRT